MLKLMLCCSIGSSFRLHTLRIVLTSQLSLSIPSRSRYLLITLFALVIVSIHFNDSDRDSPGHDFPTWLSFTFVFQLLCVSNWWIGVTGPLVMWCRHGYMVYLLAWLGTFLNISAVYWSAYYSPSVGRWGSYFRVKGCYIWRNAGLWEWMWFGYVFVLLDNQSAWTTQQSIGLGNLLYLQSYEF